MAFSIIALLYFSSFFLFYVLALFSTQIKARDSYSFGKFQTQNPNNVFPFQTNEKKEQDDDQNPSFIPDSESGYGLYGHEKEEFNTEDSFSNNPSLTQTQESYENYPRTIESRYENVESQGMSDTRFIDNGNYFFDLNDERNHGNFYRKHYRNPTGYYEKEKSFKNPYNSELENNQQSRMFGEEQTDQFTP